MDSRNDDLSLAEITLRYATEEAARGYFERLRWPGGVVCPHCGNSDRARIYARTAKESAEKSKRVRAGLYKCGECKDTFTVTVGTVMEDSHVPLQKWLIGFYMICASKTQVSALQLQRQLELGSYRTALFLCHRIRYALEHFDATATKLSGEIEADEICIGGRARGHGRAFGGKKSALVSLVQRDGVLRSTVVGGVSRKSISALLRKDVCPEAHLNTDDSPVYKKVGKDFASHESVIHSMQEYFLRNIMSGSKVMTNSVELLFGSAKRNVDGGHHNVSRQRLHLHVAEIDVKFNTHNVSNGKRAADGVRRINGKRLILRRPKGVV